MNVRIVLVEPREEGNIGAAARAMRNFEVRDLVIVGEQAAAVSGAATWWARGGEQLLASARRISTLDEALAGSTLTVATTAARERQLHDAITPDELARIAAETLASDDVLAIVFGRERSGLTREEIARCQRVATIPVSDSYPTMNLAQAVSIFCYELAKPRLTRSRPPEPIAPDSLLQHLERHARELLGEVRLFDDRDADSLWAELHALAGRAQLTRREASLLLDVIRRIERRLARRGAAARSQADG